jgi:hypothetical protein
MKRGLGTLLVAALAGALSLATFVVDAPAANADGLLGYDMTADARGLNIFTVIPDSQLQPELNIPQATATQQSGTGYALASSAWPGAIIANGGTLLGLLIPGFPPEVAALLVYPVRAEARTGQDPPTTSYDAPGLTMRSRADDTSSESEAGAQGVSVLPGAIDAIHTTAATRATANAAIATARSEVQNFDLAGVLKIQHIVSTARATSDGAKSTGTASTVITGATVNGQGVTIDETGLHFGQTSTPVDAVVQQVAKQALDAAGIKVTVGPTTRELKGASAVVGAQSLVITLTQNGYTLGFAFGGARAASVASGGDAVDDLLTGGTDVLGDVTDIPVPDGLGFGDLGGLSGLGDAAFGKTGGDNRASGAGPTLDVTPAVAATGRPLSHTAMVLGALAALLLGVGLRRLNTAVLADPTAAMACKMPGEGE